MKITIIEDDYDFRLVLIEYLKSKGFDVEQYSCASDFVKKMPRIADSPPDVILVDIKMPGISGIDFLRLTQGMKFMPPVIAMSAFGTDNIKKNAKKWGAVKFLNKPFYLEELVNIIQALKPESDNVC